MKILITTAPFESENTGDITFARQMERCLGILGHDVVYLRAQDLGLTVQISKALDTSIKLSEVYSALKKTGDCYVDHILKTVPKDTVLFMHFRIPHTGFGFSVEHISQLKSEGYKICALINEHTCNREEPTEIERNYQTAKLIPFYDQIITFNPIDRAGLLKIADSRNFDHCVDQKTSLDESVWNLFEVDDSYPLSRLLEKKISLIPAPILSASRYEAGPEVRSPHILMFGTIRRNKGNSVTLKLAELLAEKKIPDMQIKIVGRVLADNNGFCSFRQYVSSTYPESMGFTANFDCLQSMLTRKDYLIAELLSLDDFEIEFNNLCKKVITELESQLTTIQAKALPIEFHIDVNDEYFKTLCHQSRYGIKFDKKGFCDNASTIINMMGLGLIVIANKTRMINPLFTECGASELPLVLFDDLEPEAEILLQTILKLNQDLPKQQLILRNLQRVMTTLYDPMRVATQVASVLKKTLSL